MCLWWAIGNIRNMICVKINSKLHFTKMWMSTAAAQKFNAFELFAFEFNWKCHHCGLSWMSYVSNFVYKRLFNVQGPSIHSIWVSNESFRFRFRTTSRMVKQWCMRNFSSRTWSHNGQDIFSAILYGPRPLSSQLFLPFSFDLHHIQHDNEKNIFSQDPMSGKKNKQIFRYLVSWPLSSSQIGMVKICFSMRNWNCFSTQH